MKHLSALLFLLTWFSCASKGQNLVINPGFEEQDYCPCGRSDIPVRNWYNCSTYYNRCSLCNSNSIPDNIDGRLYPHEGNAFVWVSTYSNDLSWGSRNFIGGRLTAPLKTGREYYASLRAVSATPNWESSSGYVARFYSNKLGLGFSTDSLQLNFNMGQHGYPPVTPGIWMDEIHTDTVNWKLINGTFLATQDFEYLYVGNFFNQQETFFIAPPTNVNQILNSWYFIDDVKLYQVPQPQTSLLVLCQGDSIQVSVDTDELCNWRLHYIQGFTQELNFPKGVFHLVPGLTPDTLFCSVTLGDSTFIWKYPVYLNSRNQPQIYIDGNYCQDSALTLVVTGNFTNTVWNDNSTLSTLKIIAPGRYSVETTSGSCKDSAEIVVAIPNCFDEYYIPTAFTPDGDGFNDLFTIYTNPNLSWSLIIFDRWGAEIMQLNNENPFWDGLLNKRDWSESVFPYLFTLKDFKGRIRTEWGKILLIK